MSYEVPIIYGEPISDIIFEPIEFINESRTDKGKVFRFKDAHGRIFTYYEYKNLLSCGKQKWKILDDEKGIMLMMIEDAKKYKEEKKPAENEKISLEKDLKIPSKKVEKQNKKDKLESEKLNSKRKITVWLSKELYDKLIERVREEERSIGSFVRQLIRNAL